MKFLYFLTTVFMFITSSLLAQTDPIRIACIGNSITEGWSLSSPTLDSYPPQAEIILGDGYIVGNFGVSARTMLKNGDFPIWNESLFEDALEFEPDVVTILLGSNDSKPHNWVYADEYLPDYIAMIDTFRQLDSNPVVYACYPPPSFGDPFGIRNAVIADEIIPMIDQIVDSLDISKIDFYTPFLEYDYLFLDGVHPCVEGQWRMAQMLADTLAGVKLNYETEVNLAKNKQVTVNEFDELFPPERLNDGDRLSNWKADGFENWAIINIGDVEEIDMFQVNFGDEFNRGYQYTIDVSSDSVDWTTVVDQSARNDTATQVVVDKINPIEAQYIKITVTGASNSEQEITSISEFKILKSAFVHSPVLNWRLKIVSNNRLAYYLDIIPTSCDEEMIKYCTKVDDGIFSSKIGFRPAEVQEITVVMNAGEVHHIYTETYKNGEIIISDTISVSWDCLTTINPKNNNNHPVYFNLRQNYPNPFNPKTTISFGLSKRANANIEIYNILGDKVKVLGEKYYQPGNYSVVWDGRDSQGNMLASGVYYYRLMVDNLSPITNKMLFLK